ncbi:hypothetical protein J5690_10580 [bacterium]|nr:hypothetical protein [bacterium]
MSYNANIIYFSARSDAEKIAGKLSDFQIKPKLFPVKKCLVTEDISARFLFDRSQAGPLEKTYLRDGKADSAALISIQKTILDRILSEADENTLSFVEESFVPESFYIRKALNRCRRTFFSFGRLAPEFGLSIVRGALDLGFHDVSFLNISGETREYNISSRTLPLPDFNGTIAIDAPPDSIPSRYLHFFRSPLSLTKTIIRFYGSYLHGGRHSEIFVYSPKKVADCYTASERTGQFVRLLGARGKVFSDFSELHSGTTVLTWSTKRFFSLLKNGFRPIPLTRCLSARFFDRKAKSPAALFTGAPDMLSFLTTEDFLHNCELGKFKIK